MLGGEAVDMSISDRSVMYPAVRMGLNLAVHYRTGIRPVFPSRTGLEQIFPCASLDAAKYDCTAFVQRI